MKIDVDSLSKKLNSTNSKELKEHAVDQIAKYIQAIKDFENSGQETNTYFENDAQKAILAHFQALTETMQKDHVMDTLRHCFDRYAKGGLLTLYTGQENEGWYPTIILTDVLEPNDIASLPETVTIYRGCEASEYKSKKYRQSWTTSQKIADQFAYHHYAQQPWFNRKDRVVLKVLISKDGILYYSNNNCECEVVVKPENLSNPEKIS